MEDIEAMNDLFSHYIFFQPDKKGANVWTSCCGRTERSDLPGLSHNQPYTCPWCGKAAILKDLRKAGRRKTLQQYEYVLLLHARGGVLYADAVALGKLYETEADLTAKPERWLCAMYRFAPGDVLEVDYQTGELLTCERERLGRRKLVQEPFKQGSVSFYSHRPYWVLNREALILCPATRYCGYFDIWHPEAAYCKDFVSYLTAYCMYPRQIEMLVKAGLRQPVNDLILERKKNAGALNWEEPDIRKSMGLTGPELREVLERKPPMLVLELRNLARRWFGQQWSIREAWDFYRAWGEFQARLVLCFCRYYKLEPRRLMRYLEFHQVIDPDLPWASLEDVFQLYKDYLESAWTLGLCMEHGRVLWPEDLRTAHDQVTNRLAERREQQELEQGKWAAKGAFRRKKYSFELDGLRIVFPLTAAAIRREGKALSHCVGGYAERHVKGVLTILFLRKASELNVPYVTIEMDGNRIVQVHGYKNDLGQESPRVTHKEFFDTWLAWLKAGSKRDQDGKPVLTKKRKEVA